MATGDVYPNGDAAVAWTAPAGQPHYEEINETGAANCSPAGADTLGYIQAQQIQGDDNQNDIFNMTTIASVSEVTQVEVKVYGSVTNESPECDINLGGWVGVQETGLTAVAGWHTITFAGLSGSQSDLDSLQVKLIADVVTSKATNDVCTLKCTITYTEVSAWGHKFIGVAGASIGKVSGVAIASIADIKGVDI